MILIGEPVFKNFVDEGLITHIDVVELPNESFLVEGHNETDERRYRLETQRKAGGRAFKDLMRVRTFIKTRLGVPEFRVKSLEDVHGKQITMKLK